MVTWRTLGLQAWICKKNRVHWGKRSAHRQYWVSMSAKTCHSTKHTTRLCVHENSEKDVWKIKMFLRHKEQSNETTYPPSRSVLSLCWFIFITRRFAPERYNSLSFLGFVKEILILVFLLPTSLGNRVPTTTYPTAEWGTVRTMSFQCQSLPPATQAHSSQRTQQPFPEGRLLASWKQICPSVSCNTSVKFKQSKTKSKRQHGYNGKPGSTMRSNLMSHSRTWSARWLPIPGEARPPFPLSTTTEWCWCWVCTSRRNIPPVRKHTWAAGKHTPCCNITFNCCVASFTRFFLLKLRGYLLPTYFDFAYVELCTNGLCNW